MAKEARGDAGSCETRCSAERAKAFCWFWKGLQLRTGSAWGLAMADASRQFSSVAGYERDGGWWVVVVVVWLETGDMSLLLWKELEVGETGESVGWVASRVALQSEIRFSRDASLKPCEARRDEVRLDEAGMRR